MRVLKVKTGIKKRTKLGLELEESAKEILAHVKGEKKLATRRLVLPDEVGLMYIRNRSRVFASGLRQQSTR